MNILGDFINRVDNLYPEEIDNEQLEGMLTTIKNQGDEIEAKNTEITRLHAQIEKIQTVLDKMRGMYEKEVEKVTEISGNKTKKKAGEKPKPVDSEK